MLTSRVDFRFDIVGNLPLEINILIFRHLELDRVFQAHRVCRHWRQFLSYPPFGGAILQPWISEGGMNLRIPQRFSSQEILSAKAEHIHAFRTGHSFSMVVRNWIFEFGRPRGMSVSSGTSYSHGRLAWIGKDEIGVKLLDIESGLTRLFTSHDREKIINMAISKSLMVIVLASGVCLLWSLHSESSYSFRLASAAIEQLVVVRDTVALLHNSYSRGLDPVRKASITTWTKSTEKTSHFSVKAKSSNQFNHNPRHRHLLIHPDGNALIFLEMVTDSGDQDIVGNVSSIFSTRLGLDGTNQSEIEFDCRAAGFSICQYHDRFQPVLPQKIDYHFMVTIGIAEDQAQHLEPQPAYLLYDLKKNRFWLSTQIFVESDGSLPRYPSFRWKNIAHSPAEDQFGDVSLAVGRQKGNFSNSALSKLEALMGQSREDVIACGGDCFLYGDETFLVFVSPIKLVIWCFEKYITMANCCDE